MGVDVDWEFARTVAKRVSGDDAFSDSYHAASLEVDLLELSVDAERLVEIETGLVSAAGPARAKVTDRLGWVDANLASFERLMRPLLGRLNDSATTDGDTKSKTGGNNAYDTNSQTGGNNETHGGNASETDGGTGTAGGPAASDNGNDTRPGTAGPALEAIFEPVGRAISSVGSQVGPKVAGAELGALLGWMSSRVLGQYDLLIAEDDQPDDQDWVYYVGPNILSLEKRYGFPPREFRLWIAVHECTHRAQFTGVPWLRPYFLSLVNELLDSVDPDPKRFLDAIGDALAEARSGDGPSLKEGGLSVLLASPEQRETMKKVTGLMSLLEGHGDITMDRATADLIPSQRRFARVMSQRRKNASGVTRLIQRLTGLEAKLAQYEEGEDFVKTVETAGGRELFDIVWSEPEALPTIDEIREPQLWIDRVRTPAGA